MDVISRLSRHIAFLIMIITIPLMFITVYGAVARYFFKHPDIRVMFFGECCYGILFSLGGAYALKTGALVSMDFLYKRLPSGFRRILDALIYSIIIISCVVLILYAAPWAWYAFLIKETSTMFGFIFQPEVWWLKWVLLISIGLMTLQALSMAWEKVVRRR
ncbi:MAG: TRAP transporter small permease [Thermoprotei archaeon]|nr:MAG: TRAP transporter small permease [Thermoprotei archaeon]